MTNLLKPSHPDFDRKVTDKRDGANLEWTLYKNQHGHYWNGGAIGGSILCNGEDDGVKSPYRVGGVIFNDFDRAAEYAIKQQGKRYKDAVTVVQNYEKHVTDTGWPLPP